MSAVANKEQIFSKVQEALVDALGVDEEEVTPKATLQGDLGAESIDFLDIVFRLEKAFGLKIDQSELFPEAVLSDANYVTDGKVTDTGMAELRKRLPHINLDEFNTSRKVDEFSNVFTVRDIANFVQAKLG